MKYCVNIRSKEFQEFVNTSGLSPAKAYVTLVKHMRDNNTDEWPIFKNKIKPGVSELFESNPELANIGTVEQYSQYLDTIFPDSKVKDIVYHGAMEELLPKDGRFKGYVTYFTDFKKYAEIFGFPVNRKVISAIINVNNPFNAQSELADVPEEIHLSDQFTNPRIIKSNSKGYDSVIGIDAGQKEGKTIAVFEPEQIHILGSKDDIKRFEKFINNEPKINYQKVEYDLKVVDALLDLANERTTIRLNSKEQPYIEKNLRKILAGKGVSNNQIDFIFDYMRSNNIQEISTEQLAIDIEANYSYTIEINTTKEKSFYHLEERTNSNNEKYYAILESKYNKEITRFYSFEKAKEYLNKYKDYSTQYYSNLTVPGGTNYTENEIATPAIIPSIKGHPQFAKDNGIGWFRSDDKDLVSKNGVEVEFNSQEEYDYYKNLGFVDNGTNKDGKPTLIDPTIDNTKTRRILEVQSDLFQNGRDSKVLSKKLEIRKVGDTFISNGEQFTVTNIDTDSELYELITIQDSQGRTTTMRRTQLEKRFDERGDNGSDNQFLQLLNKDNNWVTFFIKSIIQDSVKKGYEKVLFPIGDTASKVQGLTTLEKFKEETEDKIKEFENKKPDILEEDGKFEVLEPDQGATIEIVNTREEAERVWEKRYRQKYINDINRLKQELERVEREGFGALKPIWNFYENTVTNILKKNYTVKKITDEYGNTWNEISLLEEQEDISKPITIPGIEMTEDEQNQIDYCMGNFKRIKLRDGLGTGHGKNWEIVKDFKGPSHEGGGIDIEIKKGSVSLSNKQGRIKAPNGLIVPSTTPNPEYKPMSKVLTERNKDLPWVQRVINNDERFILDEDGNKMTHRLSYAEGDDGEAYVFPEIIERDGELVHLSPEEAMQHAKDTKTEMRVPNVELAKYYSQNGLIKH